MATKSSISRPSLTLSLLWGLGEVLGSEHSERSEQEDEMATLFAKRKAVGKQLYEEIWDLWLSLDKIQENKFDEPETSFIANLENDLSESLDKLQKAGFKIEP